MANIPKAFHSFEKKEMTVYEYEVYLKSHSHQYSLKGIKCVECGDILTFCHGNYNKPYFKHSPTHEGHSYCALYNKGTESKTKEALIRKKLFKEEDISLNYELLYKNGKWKSLITIPPFKRIELTENESNKTIICIKNYNSDIEIPIDYAHFQPGEIKKIYLTYFSNSIRIKIKGNSTKQNISYNMEGFIPSSQLFTSFVTQNYIINDKNNVIDLKKLNFFSCRRIKGYTYTGRHYLCFSNDINYHLKYVNSSSIEIKRINFQLDSNFRCYVFDVLFKSVEKDSKEFCNFRECELVQRDDANIIWPPIKTVGNYRYYPNFKTNIFILFENESRTLEIKKEPTFKNEKNSMRLFFKIQNINSESYYVTLDKRKNLKKQEATLLVTDNKNIDFNKYEHKYYLNKGVLINKCDSKIILENNNELLLINSQLDRAYITNQNKSLIVKDKLLNAIRYSREYIKFKDNYYKLLVNKYTNNELIKEYLEYCNKTRFIKKKVLQILIEEEK